MEKRPVDILLDVISPDRTLVHRLVGRAEFPGTSGRFVVLKDHAPLISPLEKGEIVYSSGEREERLQVSSGFVEVCGNHITACVEI